MSEKIYDTITKLLAKAESTNSQQEAEALIAKAHELLVKHNLDPEALKKSGEADEKIVVDISGFRYPTPVWRALAFNLSRLYFCQAIINKTWDDNVGRGGGIRAEFHFIGREHNAAIARSMFDYLTKTIIRMAQNHTKVRPDQLQFERGCLDGINMRLRDLYLASSNVTADTGDTSGLPALYQNEHVLIEEWIKENMSVKEGKARAAKRLIDESYKNGLKAAKDINLSPQIPSGTKGAKLIS